ncbi:hypothetical protein L226DRAFT_560830 [Lentinus tigrinus ALCF2SS1-7]|uniref:F-box domain-containing protein n=1 Tax=Lentinus tigrinus ALCF2SS1-6 TaxID=1328759 RepID=A0A5C2RW54_9APHY|nr:hypothetical protein L227DRAFT_566987 [Lentinus tigrinus ALCF2SS1-6]RPD74126.1 hypothetical protein L226DRAFT_560830 [Lentinus tigrinus ALCF2SS1-7]
MVLKSLRPDKRTLLSCSLLSKSWRDICLPLVFSSIIAKSNTTFSGLFSFLLGHPHLAKLVKSISFQRKIERVRYPVPKAGVNLIMVTDERMPSFDCVSFADVLPVLVGLQQLIFENIKPSKRSSQRGIGNAVAPFRLQRLELYDHRSTLALLPALLSVLSINTVHFGRIALRDGVSPFVTLGRHTALVIPDLVVTRTAAGLLGPLRTVVHRSRLRSLTVAVEIPDQLGLLCSFVLDAGAMITSLDVSLSHLVHEVTRMKDAPPVRWASLGEALLACRNLETLRIAVPVVRPSEIRASFAHPGDDPRLSLFSGIFTPRNLPRTLREVTVGLDCDGFTISMKPAFTTGTRPELWDLAALDAALSLSAKTLQELRSVKVEVGISEARRVDVPFLKEAITQALPNLSAGVLLEVVSRTT